MFLRMVYVALLMGLMKAGAGQVFAQTLPPVHTYHLAGDILSPSHLEVSVYSGRSLSSANVFSRDWDFELHGPPVPRFQSVACILDGSAASARETFFIVTQAKEFIAVSQTPLSGWTRKNLGTAETVAEYGGSDVVFVTAGNKLKLTDGNNQPQDLLTVSLVDEQRWGAITKLTRVATSPDVFVVLTDFGNILRVELTSSGPKVLNSITRGSQKFQVGSFNVFNDVYTLTTPLTPRYIVADNEGFWVLVTAVKNGQGSMKSQVMYLYYDFKQAQFSKRYVASVGHQKYQGVELLDIQSGDLIIRAYSDYLLVDTRGEHLLSSPFPLVGARESSVLHPRTGFLWSNASHGSMVAKATSGVGRASFGVAAQAMNAGSAKVAQPDPVVAASLAVSFETEARKKLMAHLLTAHPKLWELIKAINHVPAVRDALVLEFGAQKVKAEIWNSFVQPGQSLRTSSPQSLKLLWALEADPATGQPMVAVAPGVNGDMRVRLSDFHAVLAELKSCQLLLM